MAVVMISIWLVVWLGIAFFFASMGETENGFPMFIFPLLFGWTWPGVLVFTVICAPFIWVSERATAKAKREAES